MKKEKYKFCQPEKNKIKDCLQFRKLDKVLQIKGLR